MPRRRLPVDEMADERGGGPIASGQLQAADRQVPRAAIGRQQMSLGPGERVEQRSGFGRGPGDGRAENRGRFRDGSLGRRAGWAAHEATVRRPRPSIHTSVGREPGRCRCPNGQRLVVA